MTACPVQFVLTIIQEMNMQFSAKNMRRVGAALLLAAVSGSVLAQSSDYRRGFDDGFAAGQRAAQGERGRGGGGGGWGNRMRIDSATYGARGVVCDARQGVAQEADRNGGAVVVGNQLCGDPVPRVRKSLTVVYRCGDDQPLQASAREEETLRLVCRR
jgi:hypothetical protein